MNQSLIVQAHVIVGTMRNCPRQTDACSSCNNSHHAARSHLDMISREYFSLMTLVAVRSTTHR